MALYLTERDVQHLLTMEIALTEVENAFKAHATGDIVNQPRSRIPLPNSAYNLMSAGWISRGVVGHKSYVATRSGVGFHVMLYSAKGEGLLAILEASRLGQMRTGAASGVATRYMAVQDASSVGIIGAGYQARTQLAAVAAVRPVSVARVYSRDPQRREAFAREMTDALGLKVLPAVSVEACVDGADIVLTITGSSEPVLGGEMLSPGVHINAAGANSWLRRELDTQAVVMADVIATDDKAQAKIECAELMRAVESGRITWGKVYELGEIVSGRVAGRTAKDQITLFESQGVAMEDVAVAARLYDMAKEQGIGTRVPAR
ncbi:MAG: ornithine cyclodeaminase family protein [Chloroflexi bacterium]|nr:ornithine cyclodeaminase family protein [Chloroflexota bacterium]